MDLSYGNTIEVYVKYATSCEYLSSLMARKPLSQLLFGQICPFSKTRNQFSLTGEDSWVELILG
jgi:hypothetical protein